MSLVIKNKEGRSLNSLEEWKIGFIEVDKKPRHWKEGYSAYSLGYFFTERDGRPWLDDMLKSVLGEAVQLVSAEIEHPSQLDTYKGGQRMQDLAIWGKTESGKTCFIGIEAKVKEPFGDECIARAFEAAKIEHELKPKSMKETRIRELISFLFDGKSPDDEALQCLRYQLVHYFAGSLFETPSMEQSEEPISPGRARADIVVLPVLVFKTQEYLKHLTEAEINYQDYLRFIDALNFQVKEIEGRKVYHRRFGNQTVYTFYEVQSLL